MAYQVIARKYRPQRFSDVVGQEHVTQTLANAIRQNRIAHAYLFVGPRGTGKTTIARIFAKCLNCTGGPSVDFAEDDSRCREIAEGRSLDVLEIDGASNRGIDEIRDLRDTVKYAPASSKHKIYIIDEVHMLTKEAFNALLKTLEEPPEHVKFMFATTEPEKVLPTILSRCQRFDLRRIPAPLISSHLALIARQENVQADPAALHAVARGAEGCMRDAESALDQLISFCGSSITEDDVLAMFGLTAQSQILALAEAILQARAGAALELLHQLSRNGKDLGRLLADLMSHFRNLLIFQVSQGDLALLELPEAETASVQKQAGLCDPDVLTRLMEVLTEAEGRYRDAASKKIFLEVTLLKAIQAREAAPLDAVLDQLRQLREGGSGAAPAVRAAPAQKASPAAATPSPPARQSSMASPPSPPPAPASAAGTLDTLWGNLLEAVGRASAFAKSYLVEAHPVSLSASALVIGFDPEFSVQMELANNQRTITLLQTKLKELGHPGLQLKFVQAESLASRARPSAPEPDAPPPPAGSPAPAPAAPSPSPAAAARPAGKDDFKNDPLIQKALELFKGQIVEVRA